MSNGKISLGLTDHLESPRERSSKEVIDQVANFVKAADRFGIDYYWFTEHHANAHFGHMPTPLLFALYMAGRTRRIKLGTAIICLNLHDPLDIAEQVCVADHLMNYRCVPGFGSGSTPEEFAWFGKEVTDGPERHERFESALLVVKQAWSGKVGGNHNEKFQYAPHDPLPVAADDLVDRSWVAVNSAQSAAIAGRLGFNVLFSHLRTPSQYVEYAGEYRQNGGGGLLAANRPIYVGRDDRSARREIEPVLRKLWRRFQSEGKISAAIQEPDTIEELALHPINFIIGGPESVAQQIRELHRVAPFDIMNGELNWAGLSPGQICASIRRFAQLVGPKLQDATIC